MSGDILVHYGVKGMKWGVRKELDIALARSSQRRGNSGAFR